MSTKIDRNHVIVWSGMEMRRTPCEPSVYYPDGFYIEHRKLNSQWWDISNGLKQHTNAAWSVIEKEGIAKAQYQP